MCSLQFANGSQVKIPRRSVCRRLRVEARQNPMSQAKPAFALHGVGEGDNGFRLLPGPGQAKSELEMMGRNPRGAGGSFKCVLAGIVELALPV